jgi:hypothetical protein
MTQIIPSDILRTEIANHLHELAPNHPIAIEWAGITITYDDYMTASCGERLGDVMADPIKLHHVLNNLDDIANDRWLITK